MSARLFAFVVWAAVAASAVFWGLRLMARPLPVPPQATWAAPGGTLPAGDLTKLFGAVVVPVEDAAAPPPADDRFKLLGVVAPAAGQPAGLALISIDGAAPKAVAVGGVVEGELRVRSVSHRRVELGARGDATAMVLELPTLPEPARGVPAQVGAAAVPVMPAPARRAPMPPRPGLVPGVPPQPLNTLPQASFGTAPPNPAPFGATGQPPSAAPQPHAPPQPHVAPQPSMGQPPTEGGSATR